MKIEKPVITKFRLSELKFGVVFNYKDEYYIRTNETDFTNIGVVNLETGSFCLQAPDTQVELVRAKVVIE